MTERFLRARTRLSQQENVLHETRMRNKKLGQNLPDEIIKVPQIGEWELKQGNQQSRMSYEASKKTVTTTKQTTRIQSRPVQPFPPDIQLSEEQKQRIKNPEQKILPREKAKPISEAPFPFKSSLKFRKSSPQKQTNTTIKFPTSTTNIDSILTSKYRIPKPLPPLKDSEQDDNKNDENKNVAPFLPLELFDDTTYEEFSLEYLLKHPKAWSKYKSDISNDDIESTWRPCTVIDYDPVTFFFTIEWNDDHKKKKVARFNLRFDCENPDKFAERIEAAKRGSLRYEMQFRFDSRVQSMPTEDLPELAPQNLERIVMMMNIPRDVRYERLVNDLIEDVCCNFKFMNNKFEFEFELEHNSLVPNREDFLPLLQRKSKPVKHEIDFKSRGAFNKNLEIISRKHLQAYPNVLEGLQIIWSIFMNSESMKFLNGSFDEVLELEDFIQRQKEILELTTKKFKASIQETLESAISSTNRTNEEGVPLITDPLSEERLKFKTMVILTIRMLHTVMLDIVGNSLDKYLSLFRDRLEDDTIPPQFSVFLKFGEKSQLIPSVQEFKKSIMAILDLLEEKVIDLPIITIPLYDVNVNCVSFYDCRVIIQNAKIDLEAILDKIIEKVDDINNSYKTLSESLRLNLNTFAQEFDPKGQRTLDEYRQKINEFEKAHVIVSTQLVNLYHTTIFNIDCAEFKTKASQHINKLITCILNRMKEFAVSDIHDLLNDFQKVKERVKTNIETPEQLSSLQDFIHQVSHNTKKREIKIKTAMERFSFLEEFHFEISNDECQEKYQSLQVPYKIKLMIEEANRTTQVKKTKMICQLRQNQRELESDSLIVAGLLPSFISKYQDLELTVDACDEINEIQAKLLKLKSCQEKYISHDKLFNFEPTPCKILNKLIDEFNPLHMLWNLASEWLTMDTTWLDTPFPQIRPDAMNAFMSQANKKINKLKKDLLPNPLLIENVLIPLIDQIEKFKVQIPLIAKLRHPGIKTKHWEMISSAVGFTVASSMEMTLQEFLSLDLGRWNDQISEITNKASNEYNIETSLDQMDNELQTQQFVSKEFKDTNQYILTQIDDIVSLVDDQLVTTQTLLTSPFIAPNKKRALERLTFLRLSHDILDQWIECQRGWLYLQPIFTGTSIQRKLFRESQNWASVDRTWSAIMNQTHKHPEFNNVMHRDNLLNDLKTSNGLLESITQGLNAYLEAKRHGFPRFFFLSNDELIEILSHTKDFDQIQKSMNKLFEYVQTITVNDELLITAMNDDGLESVQFHQPVNGNTPEIEDWLNSFEEEMKTTLRLQIKQALEKVDETPKDKWISEYPAQAILIANQIVWTQKVTQSLETRTLRQMKLLQQKFIEGLNFLTSMVRQKLTPATRQVISCLLINDVHNRDIITSLNKQEVVDPDSFKWQVQLRYYWEDEKVIVKSINNVYEYSYEYAGNSARLVITPLTDRCYQTLLSSFKQNLSGAPSGPAGTGKTETVRDCAKALGRPCVVYNCSEEVTPEQMSQFFAGLSTSGSWSCFDEFNRINIEVLSVIAQQVRTIQNAIASNVDTFVLDERTLKLNKNAAICITMNPGYAGRTELPDNLKALFRPCAMMVPDFVFISEIMLFSGGFTNASSLSVKLVALFDLCRTQLSKAHHYDWGMRAMKSILSTAAKAKRNDLDKDESLLLVNSIRDCTKPRLVSSDILLFENIIHDVFPDIELNKSLPEKVQEQLIKAFEKLNCIPLQVYLNKSYELYETTMLRHGLMLVGGPMGGKSVSWKALQIAMNEIAKNDENQMAIHIDSLNPKSISIPELYGLFDPITSGWSDGVLSSKIRDCSMSEPTEYMWIVVDGPVDSLWIETMNSLLDDNKVLCLSNNERIALGNHVRMVFEVDDLSQASPATVSRCGMVYFDPSTLPFTALIESYVKTVENEKLKEFMNSFLNENIPKIIEFIDLKGKMEIGNNSLFMLKNMFKLLKCFDDILRQPIYQESQDSDEVKEIDPLNESIYFSLFKKHENQKIPFFKDDFSIFENIVVFCVIWSFGANLTEETREIFSDFIKSEFNFIPKERSSFDYFYNIANNCWEEWCDGFTGVQITKEKPLESQLIPTNETASIMYISRLLVNHEVHMLLSGPESCKTLVLKTLTNDVLESKFDCRNLPFANCSTSKNVLKVLRSFMQKRHGCFGPLDNQKLVIFLDNLNSIRPEIYGAQPPLELIRQFFDYGGWYDTSKVEFQHVVDTTLLAAMGEPGGGLYTISNRLLRHFFYINIPKYSLESMKKIIDDLLRLHLNDTYPTEVRKISTKIADASISIFEKCVQNLLPIPSKSHYIFSLRSLVRVLKGMMLCPSNEIKNEEEFVMLWKHEMLREFHDRFNTNDDRDWFMNLLTEIINSTFSIENSKEVIFTDFIENSSSYHQTKLSIDEILDFCRNVLHEHNQESSKPLDIVLFKEAVSHITSLTRILTMKRGHSMLVGVKSSGRKSLSRLALHMAGMEVFEVQITRTYGFNEWRDDMKSLMKQCGTTDTQTGFMITDSQIIGSFQLEDISNILINGEIPNLFERDEIDQIKADIVQNEILTDGDPWELFQSRVQNNLHLILVFSPFGTIFKESILSYPALRTETTIDWYMPWSSDALESVARASLEKVSFVESEKRLLTGIVNVCVKIHKSVEKMALLFLKEQKRFTACTPSRYFELISTFIRRLSEKRKETSVNITKYKNGVDQIKATRVQIEELSKLLDRDIPMLQQKRQQVEEMLLDLQQKRGEVEDTRAQVQEQSQLAEIEAAAAKETNKIAQEKLAAAQPILQAAQDAVDSIDRDSLVNIKTLKKIHPALRETFDAICIIFGRQPRKVDSGVPGVKEDDYWPETLSLLNDIQFIKKVKMFEIEKLTRETINKLRKYVGANKKEREEKRAAVESGYVAAANLYNWVCASYDYWFIYQEILPKKIEAEEAAAKLAKSEKILAKRRSHLQSVEDQLKKLMDKYDEEMKNEKSLADSVDNTKLRLQRANEIMNGLSGETKRWSECASNLEQSSTFILGDSLLISASLTHLGAFGPTYRMDLLDEWKKFLKEEEIKYSETFTISSALGNDPTIRDWIVKGLPNDSHSVENALIIENAIQSFPLLIDPQLSGTKWLCSILNEKLVVLRFDQSDFIQRLKSCVQFGIAVLIENIGLKLDPLIEPILSREQIIVDGVKKIAIGGEFVSYSESFRLYLTTKYPNPHYSPEVCSQVTLINFTTTETGLTDLLMNNLIEVEQEELDKMRIENMEKNAENTKKLLETENEILQIVSNVGSDILDDDTAINTLKSAQKTSSDIANQIEESKKTEKLISDFRETYKSVAERAALLYFCASDFAVVDPMYQFSLKWFVSLFKASISKAEHSENTNELISNLNATVATSFFESVSFSLFSRHKLLFSTLMATRILTAEKEITKSELAFLLSADSNQIESNRPKNIEFISDDIWSLLLLLEKVSPSFENIVQNIQENQEDWKEYIESNEPETKCEIPLNKTVKLTSFQKLLILRVFHLHRVREGLRLFVSESLGTEFVTPPPLNLSNVFKNSSPLCPLIFIITPGIDPVEEVTEVATSMELDKYLTCYSLGRGRGAGAEQLIEESSEKGFWLMLQNCHLSLSWMPRLEYLIDHMDTTKVSDRFRLCLVTMSDDRFPIGILYQGTKLIYEIPKGIRENMLRIYNGMNPDEYMNETSEKERQLTFHLAFYHSVVLERLQFGSIGWNIPYEFNPSDLMISRKHLKTFLIDSSNEIPFESLSYVIGELNYGGRVTDPLDRRLLLSLLKKYFSEDINNPDYSFGPRYPIPHFSDNLQDVLNVISNWPIVTEGADVGLSMNASTIIARNDAFSIFNNLIEIQPTLVAASGETSEEQFALKLVETLLLEIPNEIDMKKFEQSFDLSDTINTVLNHEIILYNDLINEIKASLIHLQKGLKGLIVIDEKLEQLKRRIVGNKIPEIWKEKSFPSILSLRSYIGDLRQRVKFIDDWVINKERPKVFKLGAFFHPEEFTTAVLQVYSRKHKVSFDSLKWASKIYLENEDKIEVDEGIIVDHLFLEGAKFDVEKNSLVECGQRELISQIPSILLYPTQNDEEGKDLYQCPLYRMQNRGTGAIDLPNHIMDLYLPTSEESPDHWIQRSVALFLTIQT